MRTTGVAHEVELTAVSEEKALRLRAGLEAAGLKQERRALRLRPQSMQWRWPETDALELSFALPPGTYATVVLHEVGHIIDASARGFSSHEGASLGA